MRAALAQLSPRGRDPFANAGTAVRVLEQHRDADLVVFPELFLTGYVVERIEELAAGPDSPPLAQIAVAARRARTAVVVGFIERVDGGVANSLACFDSNGSLAGVYRKTHLFGVEAQAFVPGDRLLVTRLAGRNVGLLICFDVEFPEPARALARAGADLLVTAAANMEPFGHDHEVFVPARAFENHVPHLYVNCCGSLDELRFVGRSCVIDAHGHATAEARDDREQVLTASVGPAGATDERVDYLAHLRGDLSVETPFTTSVSSGGST
jgi:predicted amidohydrolase